MTGTDVRLEESLAWNSPSDDPNDETFGDVVEATTLEGADEYEAILVGEPYDGAVIGRRGARAGPTAIREALASVKSHHVECGPVDGIGDLGDVRWPTDEVDLDDADVAAVQERTETVAAAVYEGDALPVFLGGDNSLTVPNVGPLLESGRVGVVNFDAHLDVREPVDGPTSGTPYRQLLDRGLDAYAVVGARHFETSNSYVEGLQNEGGAIVTAEQLGTDRERALTRARRALSGVDALYVSVDVDVLDATAAPGVSAPTPGGLTSRELFRSLRELCADPRLVGLEIVECAPPLDDGDRTARAAARAVAHALAGYGDRHERGGRHV